MTERVWNAAAIRLQTSTSQKGAQNAILYLMRSRGLKRVTALLVLLALFATTLRPLVPHAMAAEPCAMTMAGSPMDHHGKAPQGPMPICGDAASCIVAIAMPACHFPTATNVVWSAVRYWHATIAFVSLPIPPDHPPPKSRS